MITEQFLKFVKVEFPIFWDKASRTPPNPTEQNGFEEIYSFFWKQAHKVVTGQDKQVAYQQFKIHRQGNSNSATNLLADAKYYKALEVSIGANWEIIRTAYKAGMKKYHPDKFSNDIEKQKIAQIISQKINEAYQYLEKKLGK